MPILGIDIETYSEVDLPKCGVYAYAEHPSFEILLFAYALSLIHISARARYRSGPAAIPTVPST